MLNKNIFLFIFLCVNSQNSFAMSIEHCSLFCLPIEIQRLIYIYLTQDSNPIRLTQRNELLDGKNTKSLELKIKTLSGPITKKHLFSKKRKRDEGNTKINMVKLNQSIFFNPKNTELTFSVEAYACENKNCDVCYYCSAGSTKNNIVSCFLSKNKQTGTCCFEGFDLSDVQESFYVIENKNAGKGIISRGSAQETDPFFTFSKEEIRLIQHPNGNPLKEYLHQMTVCKK